MITTPRLQLRPATEALLLADLDGPAALAEALDVAVPASWRPELYDNDAIRFTLEALRADPAAAPWGLRYLVLVPPDVPRPTLVGIAGLKGPPDSGGVIELGYGIVAEFQRRGLATEAVLGLLEFAFGDPKVTEIAGQTLSTLNHSIGVLKKAGFTLTGEGADPHAPEDEVVVRYAIRRSEWDASRPSPGSR